MSVFGSIMSGIFRASERFSNSGAERTPGSNS